MPRGVSRQMLREDLIALLAEADCPSTAGEITKALNARGVDVRRSAVQNALQRLCTEGRAEYVWAPCQRAGRWVSGRHYVERIPREANATSDPFAGLEV